MQFLCSRPSWSSLCCWFKRNCWSLALSDRMTWPLFGTTLSLICSRITKLTKKHGISCKIKLVIKYRSDGFHFCPFLSIELKNQQFLISILLFQLVCCGANGPSDWNNGNNNTELPLSCCSTSNITSCFEIDAYKLGCKEALHNFFYDHSWALFGVITAILFIQVRSQKKKCV